MATTTEKEPKAFRYILEKYAGSIFAVIFFIALLFLPFIASICKNIFLFLSLVIFTPGLISLLLVFTRPVDLDTQDEPPLETSTDSETPHESSIQPQANSKNQDALENLNVIFRFAYGFIAIIILLSVFILYAPSYFKAQKSGEDTSTRTSYPIAVVPGCDYSTLDSLRAGEAESDEDADQNARIPEDSYCGDLPPQWVLSIGGSILPCHIDGNCQSPRIKLAEIHHLKEKQETASYIARQTETKVASCWAEYNALQSKLALQKVSQSDSAPETKSDVKDKNAECLKLESELSAQNAQLNKLQEKLDVVGKHSNATLAKPIVGGVVVPLYFLVIATLGALVSMMRKVPEYQKRATPQYSRHYKEEVEGASDEELSKIPQPMLGSEARESVLFQMLQVLSAPTLGIIAYAWAQPEEVATTSLLAFAAGFSSELILKAVRTFIEQFLKNGEGTRTPRAARLRRASERQAINTKMDSVENRLDKINENLTPLVSFSKKPKPPSPDLDDGPAG